MTGLKVEKRERENSRQLASRFVRGLRRSGLVYRIKKAQFKNRPKSSKLKKRAALRKLQIQEEYKKLEKLGKL
jgi:hypothetical protein